MPQDPQETSAGPAARAIDPCGPGALPDVHRLHRDLLIDTGRLLALVDPRPERRAWARTDLARRGGFLRETLEFDRRALRENVAVVSADDGGLLGYCTALRHRPAVEAHCAGSFGWSGARRRLAAGDLPLVSAAGTLE